MYKTKKKLGNSLELDVKVQIPRNMKNVCINVIFNSENS